MIFISKRTNHIVRLLASSLRKRFIVFVVQLFFPSYYGIRLVKVLLLPVCLIRTMQSWNLVTKYFKIMLPEQSSIKSLVRFHQALVDQSVWSTLVHNSWDRTVKYNDFSSVDDLQVIAGRGKGLLLLGMHYGPMFYGYSLNKLELNPTILVSRTNIPNIDGVPLKGLLTNEYIFRGTYDGMVAANHSEKLFIKMMMDGRPGMIMIDIMAKKNYLSTNCLGIDYPIGVFPFKLALTHSFPVAIIWFSKIKGKGYKLNVREICFSTIEKGVAQYGVLLDQIVRTDPYLWNYGPPYAPFLLNQSSTKNQPS